MLLPDLPSPAFVLWMVTLMFMSVPMCNLRFEHRITYLSINAVKLCIVFDSEWHMTLNIASLAYLSCAESKRKRNHKL